MNWKSYTLGIISALALVASIGVALGALNGAFVDNGDGTATEQFTAPTAKWINYANWLAEDDMFTYWRYLEAEQGCAEEFVNVSLCDTTTKRVSHLYEHHKTQKIEEYGKLKVEAAMRAAKTASSGDGDTLG